MVVDLYTEQVKDISVDDLKNRMKSGKGLMILDAREITAFCKGHVPGATDLFDAEIASLAPEMVEKTGTIVVYGPGQAQPSPDFMDRLAGDAIDRLKKLGFQNLMELKGGYEAWANAGNRVDYCEEKSITPAKVPLFHRTESGVRSL
jgi:rhodanese-related sulfurtransferase